jgi:hypothetical protein
MELRNQFALKLLFTLYKNVFIYPIFPASLSLVFRQGNRGRFLAYFPKVGLCDLDALCVSMYFLPI